jgi:NAD(P)-dependent dehydrogenase (short-subunit alcohol dehydrogenase family)
MTVERRVAIVTGGATGLGRGIADVLSAAGVDCVIAGRRSDVLAQTASELSGGPGRVEAIQADVTRPEDRSALLAAAEARFGKVDILVNNAGGGNQGPLLDYSPEQWRAVLDVNLEAAFFMAQAVLGGMRERGFGRIVNISSILGLMGGDGTPSEYGDQDDGRGPVRAPSYHAAKAGLTSLTRDLAVTVARWGVTVNTVSPGYIERPERPRSAKVRRQIAAVVPLGRDGEPRDIGHAVRYLVSDEANYVTGTDLVVDGGRSAW